MRRKPLIFAVCDSPVYAPHFEGSTYPVKKWLEVCHNRPFIAVSFTGLESDSRPWRVRLHTSWFSDQSTSCASLAGAEKVAERWQKDHI